MIYGQPLSKLKPLGIEQIGRLTTGGYDIALLGKPSEAVFPFSFTSYRIVLDKDLNSYVDEEIVDAILRRFSKTREELDQPM